MFASGLQRFCQRKGEDAQAAASGEYGDPQHRSVLQIEDEAVVAAHKAADQVAAIATGTNGMTSDGETP
jgi:hypothetical protein